MAQIEIDINEYLTENEKKELIIEAFKEQVKSELFKSHNGTIQSDSEVQRIIGNITGQIVMNEVQKYIPDCEKMIREKTIEALIKDNYSYYVFKKKDAWDKEESLAVTYMNETIKSCKETFQKRIKETIENYDLSNDIAEQISNEFSQMADTIYKLSDLFQSKQGVS
jgi:hypothetical protein